MGFCVMLVAWRYGPYSRSISYTISHSITKVAAVAHSAEGPEKVEYLCEFESLVETALKRKSGINWLPLAKSL
jgi:hypothetical protein